MTITFTRGDFLKRELRNAQLLATCHFMSYSLIKCYFLICLIIIYFRVLMLFSFVSTSM